MKSEKRILLINDEPEMLSQMERWLIQEGHYIKSCQTGRGGVQLMREMKFDLVFLDYHLKKELDGETTARVIIPELRKINPSVPIIVVSATERNLTPDDLGVLAVLRVTSSCWQQMAIWASIA
ncbi:response regulator [candidate division KSB1 bacterium]|nr:response regulator [candidate division KSB1 bacterium]